MRGHGAARFRVNRPSILRLAVKTVVPPCRPSASSCAMLARRSAQSRNVWKNSSALNFGGGGFNLSTPPGALDQRSRLLGGFDHSAPLAGHLRTDSRNPSNKVLLSAQLASSGTAPVVRMVAAALSLPQTTF
jgi:hypothetical protein